MMAKSQEQRWAEGYYGALVGLTVRKVEIVVDDSSGYPELWPTITMVSDDGEEFFVEVSRDQEGNGAGFLFGLPIHRDTTGKLVCERCLDLIDPQDPSTFENLKALEVGTEEMVCASCVTRAERGWIGTIVHSGHATKSDIWPEYAGECDICDLPVLYGEDEHNRETGNHLDCGKKQDLEVTA